LSKDHQKIKRTVHLVLGIGESPGQWVTKKIHSSLKRISIDQEKELVKREGRIPCEPFVKNHWKGIQTERRGPLQRNYNQIRRRRISRGKGH